ncbi:hypothetical protein T484DRAFT_1639879, partial [Baffinella frigidus]
CEECPENSKSSEAGGVRCLCAPGLYMSAGTDSLPEECLPCAAGTYSAGYENTCTTCPTSTTTSDPTTEYGATSADECCAAGKYKSLPGSVHGCERCGPGTYSPIGASLCSPCAPGTYSDHDTTEVCEPCPAGSFSVSEGAQACELCPNDRTWSPPGSTECYACADDRLGDQHGGCVTSGDFILLHMHV